MNKIFAAALLSTIGGLAGCTKDNYVPPQSQLTGHIVYNGQAVNVRSTLLYKNGQYDSGGQLELWQRGEALFTKIPVNVQQDGSFSVLLFDGDYKLTRLVNGGPWQNQTDSVDVKVRGNTVVDVPVQPYFTVSNATFTKSGNTITGTVKITKVGSTAVGSASIYLGYTDIVDQVNQVASSTKFASSLTDLSQPITLTVNIPAAAKTAMYVRIGVQTQGVTERVFTPVQRIDLQ